MSIRVPLRGIYIEGINGSGERVVGSFRDCTPSSTEDCRVDIADAASLEKVFTSPGSIPIGTYTKLTVQTCKDEAVYTAQVKGSVELGGVDYYTSSTQSSPLSQDIAALSYVTLTYHGCQRDYALPRDLSVTKDALIDLSLFFPVKNVAWAGLNGGAISEGCLASTTNQESVCMGYPDAIPYVGKTAPKLEAYAISEPPNAVETASGLILLIFDSNDDLLGGTTRRYYSEDSISSHTNFVTPLWIYDRNSDGSYHLENFGSTATTSYAIFPSFLRGASHTSKYISNNWGGQEFDYEATLLD